MTCSPEHPGGRTRSRASRRRRARDGWGGMPSRRRTLDSAPSAPTTARARMEPSRTTTSPARCRVRTLCRRTCAPRSRAASSSRASRTARGSRTPDGACLAPPRNRLAMSAEAAAQAGSHRRCPLSRRRGQRGHRAHGARPRHRTACLAESQPGQRSAPARPDAVGGRAAQLRFRRDHRRQRRGPTRQASVQCPGDTIHG